MGKKSNKVGPNAAAEVFEEAQLKATGAEALALLEQLGEKAPFLVDAWVKHNNVEAVDAAAYSEAAPAAARKLARRGLNVLKSRGLKLPEHKAAPATLTETPTYEAWLLVPDQTGIAIYAIGSFSKGLHRKVADVRVHEGAGIMDLSVGELSGAGMRGRFKNVEAERGYGPVQVPIEWARWRVARAKTLNRTSGLVLPLGFDVGADLLGPVPEAEPTHPIDAAGLVVTDELIAQRAPLSASLHAEPEFRAWLPDFRFVQELLTKVGQRLGAPPAPEDSERVNALLAEEITAATDRFFTPEARQAIALRMKDIAISVLARAGKERALDVLATAEAMRRAGLITSPPSDIPFLKSFFQKALMAAAASSNGQLSIPIPQQQVAAPGRPGFVAPPEAFEAAARSAAGQMETIQVEGEPVAEAPAAEPSQG